MSAMIEPKSNLRPAGGLFRSIEWLTIAAVLFIHLSVLGFWALALGFRGQQLCDTWATIGTIASSIVNWYVLFFVLNPVLARFDERGKRPIVIAQLAVISLIAVGFIVKWRLANKDHLHAELIATAFAATLVTLFDTIEFNF